MRARKASYESEPHPSRPFLAFFALLACTKTNGGPGMTGPTLGGVPGRRKQTYSVSELSEVADGLRRLLDLIEAGSMVADTATIRRLEGAVAALHSLATGIPVDLEMHRDPERQSET